MRLVVLATVVGLVAGVGGTGLGGLLTLVIRRPGPAVISAMLGLAAGVMLALTGFRLMPDAFETGGLGAGMGGFLLGVALLLVVDLFLPHRHPQSPQGPSDSGLGWARRPGTPAAGEEAAQSRLARAGALIGLGIALHNFPEGLAIGAGYAHGTVAGAGVALAIGLHNAPEGLAMAVPLLAGGLGWLRTVGACLLAGLPQAVGALCGAAAGAVSPLYLSLSLGTAAGAMLYLTADELIPAASQMSRGHSATFGLVCGVVLGVFLSYAAS